MKREDFVIVYLSLSLLLVQWFWVKAEKRAEYLQGKLEGLTFQMTDDNGEGVHQNVPKEEQWNTKR